MAHKKRKRKPKRWIQDALGPHKKSKRGLLHRQLGVPKGDKIPLAKLRKAAKKKGKLGQRARFAMVLRSFGK